MEEKNRYMFCCDRGYAFKEEEIFIKVYTNTAICLCRECAMKLAHEIMDKYVDIRETQKAPRQVEVQTGEVEPVVHGYWILRGADNRGRGGIWMCSACGEYEQYKKIRCPYCGAKMDGEVPNEKPQR